MTPRRRLRAAATGAQVLARRRRLITAGAAVFLALAVTALCDQYAKTYTLAREKARLDERRRELIVDNARLHDEIRRLQTDDRYIEQIARQQLGLVRPGEVELLVVPADGTVSPPGGPRDGGTAPPTVNGPDSLRPAPDAPPHRGVGAWAAGALDAMLRLLRVPRR